MKKENYHKFLGPNLVLTPRKVQAQGLYILAHKYHALNFFPKILSFFSNLKM